MPFLPMTVLPRCALLALLVLVLSPALAESPKRFYGYAFDLETDAYLYTEVHEQHIADGEWVSGRITYFDPEGRKIGDKSLDFSGNRFVPTYDYRLPELGYREAILEVGEQIEMLKVSDGSTRTDAVRNRPPIAADSGFHNFLVEHFELLLAGETVEFTFVAVGRLDTFKFRARRIEDGEFDGKPVVRFQVEANSLLRLVAPKLIVSYDAERRHLKEYRGPSNVIDPGTGEVYEARIAYYAEPPAGAPDALPPLE